MLLKFAYQDFIEDRKFRNTTKVNIQNYKVLLGGFIEYCLANEVINVEEINSGHVKSYFMECQQNGNGAGTINTKLMRVKDNVAKKVKRLKEDVRISVFTDEQIYQMLGYFRGLRRREKSYFAYRGHMLIW